MLREVQFNDLYTIIIVISLTMIVCAKLINSNRFSDFLRLIGTTNYLRIYFKDHKFFDPFDVVLFLNFCINAALISVLTYTIFIQDIDINYLLFLKLALLFGGGVLIRILIKLGIGLVFDIKILFNSYVFQQLSFLNYLGMILLPLNALLIYGAPANSNLLVLILAISGLILGVGFLKTFKSYQNLLINNLFYFILYLCTLEIGPYIILYALFPLDIN